MTASEFSGLDLSIEPVRGARSFGVDSLGRLTGVTYTSVWRPGENVAVCRRQESTDVTLASLASIARNLGMDPRPFAKAATVTAANPRMLAPDPAHDMSQCGHGFYAYYDGSNDYAADGRISAVIEGYGETVIGTRGFRSSKARIVALCSPKSPSTGSRFHRFRHWIDDNDADMFFVVPSIVGGLASLGWGIALLAKGHALLGALLLALFVLLAITAGVGATSFVMSCCRAPLTGSVSADLIAKVRRNYAEIPWFNSFDAMVKAFPPDRGTEPSPETDADFWERKA